jgi:short-subunit dehydrogenase
MAAARARDSFTGKSALVCGGSKGIGRETALALARRGASVCIVARDPQALAEAERLVSQELTKGSWVDTISCDTTDHECLRPLLEAHVERRGVPDYLINLVGCAHPHYVEDLELADYRAAMETNYYGQLVPLHILLPRFLEAGRGHIANTSSVLGFMGVMGYATYAPTKYAILGLTEVLRNEFGHRGLTFSVLFPPDTDTPGFEIENETKPREWFATSAAKLMKPEDVAEVFVRGLARRRFYITPGQSRLLWRLARWVPRLLHWYADRELNAARRRLGTD